MKPSILSIGYEGATVGDFLHSLTASRVELLIDIREFPISRKAGFSKTSLQSHVGTAGIDYLHVKTLGSPKALRHAVREDADYVKFFAGMREHLASEQSADALAAVADASGERVACLMCFCSRWERCHRRIVAEALCSQFGIEAKHISVGDERRPLLSAA